MTDIYLCLLRIYIYRLTRNILFLYVRITSSLYDHVKEDIGTLIGIIFHFTHKYHLGSFQHEVYKNVTSIHIYFSSLRPDYDFENIPVRPDPSHKLGSDHEETTLKCDTSPSFTYEYDHSIFIFDRISLLTQIQCRFYFINMI